MILGASLLIGAHITAVWHLYAAIGFFAALGLSALALPIAVGMALLPLAEPAAAAAPGD